MASIETQIVSAVRSAVRRLSGWTAVVGRFDLLAAPAGTVMVRPTTARSRGRDSGGEEFELKLLLGIVSRVRSDDPAGLHAFAQVCDDSAAVFRVLKAAPDLAAGGPLGLGEVVRGEVQYWYRPDAQGGQAGGALLPVTVTWRE